MPRRRWRIAFLLSLGVLVNYFDRVNLSVSQNALHDSFGISLIAFGFLSSAYSWTYALMQVPAGVLLDRWGVRRVGCASTLVWSAAQFGAAISSGIAGFFGASLGYLLRQPKVYGLGLGWGAYNYSFYLLLTWLPSYLSISLHVDLLHSVLYTSVPWLFATFTDLVVGGWLVDALIGRGYDASRVRQTVLVAGTAFGLGIFGARSAHSPIAALIWISVSLGGLAAAAPVAWTVPSLIAPRASVGRLGGIVNFCGQLAAISAPIVTGYVAAITHSFAPAFVAATVILLIGIAGYIFLLKRIEPIPEPV